LFCPACLLAMAVVAKCIILVQVPLALGRQGDDTDDSYFLPASIMSCEWKVLQQELVAFAPTILAMDVEGSCPRSKNAVAHFNQCEDCARLHKPSQNQFAICQGCCGTLHDADGGRLAVQAGASCDELKAYYSLKNSHALKYGSDSNSGLGHVKATVESAAWNSSNVEQHCAASVERLNTTVPSKLKFQCDACNIGSPHLLQQCCDRCMEFAEGNDMQALARGGLIAYVWCSGCDTDSVRSRRGAHYTFPFSHLRPKYSSRTEAQADANISKWVEDNVCSRFNRTQLELNRTCAEAAMVANVSATNNSSAAAPEEYGLDWADGASSVYQNTKSGWAILLLQLTMVPQIHWIRC